MTVETTTSRVSYTGAGTTGPFSVPFYFLEDNDLLVTKVTIATGAETTLTLTTDYTVSGAADEAGGSVTLVSALSSSYKLVIVRDPDFLQSANYPANDPFPSATHERVVDKLTMLAQRLKDLSDRSFRLSDGDTSGVGLELSSLAANNVITVNAAGTALEGKAAIDVDATLVTAFVKTILDDADASTVLSTLGISAFIKTLLDDADASTALSTLGITAAITAALAAWTTGDAKITFKATADTGWVLADDKSIGDASSGATGRANADTSALFTLLWTNISDTYAPVSTGRGASAAADFAAHKTLTLPRTLGRAIAVAGAGAGLTSRALGEYLGEETHILAANEMPAHTHTDRHLLDTSGALLGYSGLTGSAVGTDGISGSTGGGEAHNNMQPTSFLNVMIKL